MVWLVGSVYADPTVQDVFNLMKSLLVDLGVWSWLGAVLSAGMVLTAVSFVWRALRN